MANFKRDVTIIIEHDDLADMLTEELCRFLFSGQRVTYVSEKAGQYHIHLMPKAVVKPKAS